MVDILILAIGQSMRRDDAAGLVAVKRWMFHYPEYARDTHLRVEFLELPGFELLDYLEMAKRVLIVDAVQTGASPGSLHWLTEKNLAHFDHGSDTAHGLGVAETLALGRQIQPDKLPDCVDILGIEVGDICMGEGMSAEVAAVIEQVAVMIENWVKGKM